MDFTLIILLVSTLALVDSTPNMLVMVTGEVNYDGTNLNTVIKLNGEDQAIITDKERSKFMLSDDILKNCVEYHMGKRPTDVYLHSPTPWNDLYKTYGWRQVYRTVKPLNATILKIFTKQETVSLKMYNNTESTPTTGRATISQTFENRLTTSWSKQEELTVGGEVGVVLSLKVIDFEASTSISKVKSWGKAFDHSLATFLSDSSEVEFTVPPQGCVYVKTEVSKTLVNLRVEYEASLDGNTAVNYEEEYKGHHFHRLDLYDVMHNCGLKTELIVIQDITADLVTGVKMQVLSSPDGVCNSIGVEVNGM